MIDAGMSNGEVILVNDDDLDLEELEEFDDDVFCSVELLIEFDETSEMVGVEALMINADSLEDFLTKEFFGVDPKRSNKNLSCRVNLFPIRFLAFNFFVFICVLENSFFLYVDEEEPNFFQSYRNMPNSFRRFLRKPNSFRS